MVRTMRNAVPMIDQISFDESMRLCLVYFEDAVRSVVMSPEDIYKEFGKYFGVAWELRQELLAGKPLLEWNRLSSDEQALIREIIYFVEVMPSVAFDGAGLKDLLHPSWDMVRKAAHEFIESRDV